MLLHMKRKLKPFLCSYSLIRSIADLTLNFQLYGADVSQKGVLCLKLMGRIRSKQSLNLKLCIKRTSSKISRRVVEHRNTFTKHNNYDVNQKPEQFIKLFCCNHIFFTKTQICSFPKQRIKSVFQLRVGNNCTKGIYTILHEENCVDHLFSNRSLGFSEFTI